MIRVFIEKRNEALRAVRNNQDQITELALRLEKLQNQLPGLIAERQRAKSGDQFELDKAREAEKEVSESIEAVRKEKKQAENNIPDLNNALVGVEIELWGQVYKDMKAELQKMLGDKMIRAYAAKLKTGEVSYESVLHEIAGISPAASKIQNIQEVLAREYLD
jgi:chromosome segregation ATPase